MQVRAIKPLKQAVWKYYQANGRHDLPWRHTTDPYRVLVSEIMLQQTQVSRVLKFYPLFIKKFPNFRALARAKTSDVFRMWQGMGYNRRALALHKIAQIVLEKHRGRLPRERAALEELPGIGKATAGSIRAFAWNEPEIFIETNIRRVFIHFFAPKHGRTVTDEFITRYIKSSVDAKNAREWYWALMDYGAWLGAGAREMNGDAKEAKRIINPNRKSAHYKKQSTFAGSDRELRGKIIKTILREKKISLAALSNQLRTTYKKIEDVASVLSREGFMKMEGKFISIQ